MVVCALSRSDIANHIPWYIAVASTSSYNVNRFLIELYDSLLYAIVLYLRRFLTTRARPYGIHMLSSTRNVT